MRRDTGYWLGVTVLILTAGLAALFALSELGGNSSSVLSGTDWIVFAGVIAAALVLSTRLIAPGRASRRLASVDDLGGWLQFRDLADERGGWRRRIRIWGSAPERRVLPGAVPVLEEWTRGAVDTASGGFSISMHTVALTVRASFPRRLGFRVGRGGSLDQWFNQWLQAFGTPRRVVLSRDADATTRYALFGEDLPLMTRLRENSEAHSLFAQLPEVRVEPVGRHGETVLHEVRWLDSWEGRRPKDFDPMPRAAALRALTELLADLAV